jgi:hypothetical protein
LIEPTWSDVEAAVRGVEPADVAGARWYGGKGRAIERIAPAEAFDLGAGAVLAIVDIEPADGPAGRYLIPLRAEDGELRQAVEGDGTWRALAVAVAEGWTVPSLRRPATLTGVPGQVAAALVCRPAGALRGLVPGGAEAVASLPERSLGLDRSNTSVVLGERLILKAYRRLETGLNPDLELNAYLAEEVGFGAVPRLAGYAEMVSADGAATVALVQEFVADGADAYEALPSSSLPGFSRRAR